MHDENYSRLYNNIINKLFHHNRIFFLFFNIQKHKTLFVCVHLFKSVYIYNVLHLKCIYIRYVWCTRRSYRVFINRRSGLFEEFQTMKGTRNVTAAQTASGEAAQGARSFFSFLVTRVRTFFPMHARPMWKAIFLVRQVISQHFSYNTMYGSRSCWLLYFYVKRKFLFLVMFRLFLRLQISR